MNPTDLDQGDAGELGGVFDTITGAVNSIERFGETVSNAGTFQMGEAMIWAVILFMFFTLVVRLLRPWSDAGADRYRNSRPVIPARRIPVPRKRQDVEALVDRVEDLEEKLARALARIAELTGDEESSSQEEAERVA